MIPGRSPHTRVSAVPTVTPPAVPLTRRSHASVTGPAHPGGGVVQREVVASFDDWVRIAGSRFVKLHLTTDARSFHGAMSTVSIEDMLVSDIRASAHQVTRLPSDIVHDDPKHLKLTLQLAGNGTVEQDGRTALLTPGDVAIYDTSRPYSLQYTKDTHTLVFVFPRGLIDLSHSVVRQATAVRLRGDDGIGRVISPFMRHIAENLALLAGVNGVRIMHSALGLVSALLSSELADHDGEVDETHRADMDRFRLYIEANLGDTDLSTETVARAHFLSTRYLQYLFREERTTVSDYIRTRRLERCRLSLIDPAQAQLSILQIAQRWGFVDGAHFSRVFKNAYGLSPRAYRQAHAAVDSVEQVAS